MANASNTLSLINLPNPFTPEAWLSPELAHQRTITIYVLVGMLAIFVWDVLAHLQEDWSLLARYKTNVPTITYFISRWSSLVYIVASVVFETAPVGNCAASLKVTCVTYHVAVSSTALLFFLRVRALFGKNKYITGTFFFMWLMVLGGTLTAISSRSSVRIGPTKYCTFSTFNSYSSLANITLAVFDTCIFLAVQWRILSSSRTVAEKASPTESRSNFFGRYLPAFSRALLQDGQKYYMVAMICNLLVLVMNYLKGIPIVYRTIFVVPSVVLTNIMGCRVFRHIKLGHYTESSCTTTIAFRTRDNPGTGFVHSQGSNVTPCSIAENRAYETGITGSEVLPNGCSESKSLRLSKEAV